MADDGVVDAKLLNRHGLIIAGHAEGEIPRVSFLHVFGANCFRCIPKMDHHCPWTSNCVSHFTFPHFIRFLFYTVVGMSYLESLLFERASIVWASRDLPSVGCS